MTRLLFFVVLLPTCATALEIGDPVFVSTQARMYRGNSAVDIVNPGNIYFISQVGDRWVDLQGKKGRLQSRYLLTPKEAEAAYTNDIERGKGCYFYRANVRARALDKYHEAIEDYSVCIHYKCNTTLSLLRRGNCWSRLGNTNKAIADFSDVIRRDPQYADAWFNRGNEYMRKRNYAQAIADYDEAIRLKPNYVEAIDNREVARLRLRD